MVEKETWKDIPQYAGYYQASNLGNIRSIDRIVEWNGTERFLKGVVLKAARNKKGYLRVNIHIGGVCSGMSVHRLVAFAFIENKSEMPQVNHKNGIKTDNRASNLEWCDNSKNQKHAYENNLRVSAFIGKKGALHHNSKPIVMLTAEGGFVAAYESMNLACIDTNIKQGGISNCCNNKSKTAGGYRWMYANDYYREH